MYFSSRLQAGRMLASQLVGKYRYENCVVVALDDGGVLIGFEIARQLHCLVNMLLSEEIRLPHEPKSIGGITAEGNFVFNPELNPNELEEIVDEAREAIEEQKLIKIHNINHLLGSDGLINKDLLVGHNIILVSDGLNSAFSLDLARSFLKPIRIEKLIIATPLASVKVVDWMHINADEIYCLNVLESFDDVNHYYNKHDVPNREAIIKILSEVILKWK